ncbi:MAG: alpha-L-arabinofuranosidase C-terminal domain-containing protein, partial [Candidatus Bathyarchaeia archaeon]
MKAIDSTIKLVAVGADDPDWDLVVLKRSGKTIDYISIHQYHGSEDYYETVAAAYYVEKRLRLLADLIKHLGLEHVKIALDEWNVWYQVDPAREAAEKGMVFLEEPYALKDGLFAAGVFLALHRMSDIVGMANLAQMVNALGMIKAQGDAIVLTPIYHVFDLFVNHTGQIRLGLEIISDTYSIKAKSFVGGRLSFSLDRVPYLDGSATYDPDRQMVCLALVNFHKDETCEVKIDLKDLPVAKEIQAFELTAADPYATNDFTAPNTVVPRAKQVLV